MPLIIITTTAAWLPAVRPEDDTQLQAITAALGEALPALIAAEADALYLSSTAPKAVQVDYKQFHPRAVNGVDLWILVQFEGTIPSNLAGYSVRNALRKLITDWFESHEYAEPRLTLDAFWGPGHGFAIMGAADLCW